MNKTRIFVILTALLLALSGCKLLERAVNLPAASATTGVPLKETKLIIEHNATDDDTGFQGFFDGEGWEQLTLNGPDGPVLTIEGQGALGDWGLTELFFETVEPEGAEVSMIEVFEVLPEGHYAVEGDTIQVGESEGPTSGMAWLTHRIPDGPVLIFPGEGATVSSTNDVTFRWKPVSSTIHGGPVNIIAYQLIVEKDEDGHPHMIGNMGLSMYLPASVTRISIPNAFFERESSYEWEVLAIESSGNQTISSSAFETR